MPRFEYGVPEQFVPVRTVVDNDGVLALVDLDRVG